MGELEDGCRLGRACWRQDRKVINMSTPSLWILRTLTCSIHTSALSDITLTLTRGAGRVLLTYSSSGSGIRSGLQRSVKAPLFFTFCFNLQNCQQIEPDSYRFGRITQKGLLYHVMKVLECPSWPLFLWFSCSPFLAPLSLEFVLFCLSSLPPS